MLEGKNWRKPTLIFFGFGIKPYEGLISGLNIGSKGGGYDKDPMNTVDGRNPAITTLDVESPVNNGMSYLSAGERRISEPSTVFC